jgi:hypothetical protein
MLAEGSFFHAASYESFEAAVKAANEWINSDAVNVVNIETVVLPNIWAHTEEGTKDPELPTFEGHARWHQFVRVWYRVGE